MAEKELRSYFVHIELAEGTITRIKEAGQAVSDILKSITKDKIVVAHRSINHDQFGFFVRTSMVARQIFAALNTPRGLNSVSALRSGDKVLVVNVGNDADGIEKHDAIRWLQHR